MLKEQTLFGTVDRVGQAIDRLKTFEPPEGYYLAFSGGKDSIAIKQLAIEAGVKFDAHYSVTTIDPPELVYFIRGHHRDVIWDRPEKPFLVKLVEHGFPRRQSRWCCEFYKEGGGAGRLVITGVRWQESTRRKSRKMVESCVRGRGKRLLHPIIDWSEAQVWAFVRSRNLPYCKLYDEGWRRIGCLFCCMASATQRQREVEQYPRYAKAFRRAFRRLYDRRKAVGAKSIERWKDGNEMFEWWLTGEASGKDDGGLWLFEG